MKLYILILLLVRSTFAEKYDPCCSFPCQNFGICNRIGFTDQYHCDCYGTGYYGDNCQTPYISTWIGDTIKPSPALVRWLTTHGKLFWNLINKVEFLHDFLLKIIIILKSDQPPWPESTSLGADFPTYEGYANKTFYGRTLPPVPKDCPTPMGVAGPEVFPGVMETLQKIFTRTKFKPCPMGTSVLLPLYAQHFTHQSFKSYQDDPKLTWGSHEMDLSHLYGETKEKQLLLRTLEGGKMKMQKINGETYPPKLKDCPGLNMWYPAEITDDHKFGLGHPFFGSFPSLLYFNTLWLREHNRVCDILAQEYPNWDDERIFQTARHNIHAQTMVVTIGDYAQQISATHLKLDYKPELIHGSTMAWSSGRIHVEFNSMYHWHGTVPDVFNIGGKNYTLPDMMYNTKSLTQVGMATFTTSLSNQPMGQASGGNIVPAFLIKAIARALELNREVRLQSYNRYRQYFRLPRINTFEELTGDAQTANILKEIYANDIDAVEFLIGMIVEQRHPTAIAGIGLIEIIGQYAFRNVFSNTIGSPQFWRESTFGGEKMFKMAKSTTLQKLVCRNIKECPRISFKVSDKKSTQQNHEMNYAELKDVDILSKKEL
uniref:prostaglandin G/H synthase 2-like n=1 Tax=Styela clava TaxID=7725 RepID=UPI00193A5C88|nr:prostaglandin G/H synthase 2-like [Styela clava]